MFTGARRAALAPLLAYLRGLGVAPAATPAPVADGERSTAGGVRGVPAAVIAGWPPEPSRATGGWPRLFLASRCAPADGDLRLGRLTAADVSAFMLAQSACRSAGSLGNVVTALRSLLRFLYRAPGHAAPLAAAVPAVAKRARRARRGRWRPGRWRRLLASCDRGTAIGRRDFAILTVLVRLGLRAGEVAALRLDDIDWRAGELRGAGQGRPAAIGCRCPSTSAQAMVDYLRAAAPAASCRARVPAGRRARLRDDRALGGRHGRAQRLPPAGLPASVGAHRLRHTAATEMLRRGRRAGRDRPGAAPPPASPPRRSTPRLDRAAARPLARPWPGPGRR